MTLPRTALGLVACALAWSTMGLAAERPTDPRASRALRAMEERAGGVLSVRRSPESGLATFVSAPAGRSIPVPEAGGTPAERALSFLAEYGAAFGLRDR